MPVRPNTEDLSRRERQVIEILHRRGESTVTEIMQASFADLKPLRHYYLGDAEEIARATAAVAAQGKSRPGA